MATPKRVSSTQAERLFERRSTQSFYYSDSVDLTGDEPRDGTQGAQLVSLMPATATVNGRLYAEYSRVTLASADAAGSAEIVAGAVADSIDASELRDRSVQVVTKGLVYLIAGEAIAQNRRIRRSVATAGRVDEVAAATAAESFDAIGYALEAATSPGDVILCWLGDFPYTDI